MTAEQLVSVTKLIGLYDVAAINSEPVGWQTVLLKPLKGHFKVYPDGLVEQFDWEGVCIESPFQWRVRRKGGFGGVVRGGITQ